PGGQAIFYARSFWFAHTWGMNGERIAVTMRQPAILAIVWLCALLMLTGTLTRMPGQWHRRDFSNYYESAWALRHGIDPYSALLTPIGAQLGLETGGLLHASETPPFLLRTSRAVAAARRFLDLDRNQFFRIGNRHVSVACASTRTLRSHRVAASGTASDVRAGEFEFLLGTIAAHRPGPDGSRDARDGTRPRRHGRSADRNRRTVACVPPSARRLFCHP